MVDAVIVAAVLCEATTVADLGNVVETVTASISRAATVVAVCIDGSTVAICQ